MRGDEENDHRVDETTVRWMKGRMTTPSGKFRPNGGSTWFRLRPVRSRAGRVDRVHALVARRSDSRW